MGSTIDKMNNDNKQIQKKQENNNNSKDENALIKKAEEELPDKGRNIFFYLTGLFIISILALWALPDSAIRLDPEPKNIPSIDDIFPRTLELYEIERSEGNIAAFIDPGNPIIKQAATKIATESCDFRKENYRVCQSKAIFYFVRDNFQYVAEADEYYQTPLEMLYSRGGDCDDFTILLASMQRAIGIPVRIVHVPRHVYIQVYLDEAHSKYKQNDGWVNLDAACLSCGFGEIPGRYADMQKRVVWV